MAENNRKSILRGVKPAALGSFLILAGLLTKKRLGDANAAASEPAVNVDVDPGVSMDPQVNLPPDSGTVHISETLNIDTSVDNTMV
jgi:hypothetical protein